MKTRLLLFLLLLASLGGVNSCGPTTSEKRYELKGKVVAVEPEKHLVTVEHEEIKGYMPAMTMPFTVRNESDLKILEPEALVTATLVVDGSHSWLEEMVVAKQSGTGATTSSAPAAKEGDEVPNFSLRNQDNREIRINNYRSKALLLTFIYTRCPIPEYCTLMSNNFARIDRELGKDSELYGKTHLLSISIDPANDTPPVLRSYGAAHTERYESETFAHWEFASGTMDQVKQIAEFFGLRYYPQKDEIIHGLRTVIISPEGKVAKVYTGNDWKPEEVVEELRKVTHK